METTAADGGAPDAAREETYALFRAGRTSTSNAALLLMGSLVLFVLAAIPGGSLRGIVLVTAVLLFHELGHWVAMRLCGYQDTRIFFIPFFGAAASGRSVDASPWQEGVVLLAGPLPGLLLAVLLLVFGTARRDAFFIRAGNMLLWVNAFNLLPLAPLDGGRLFELVLFGRHRLLEAGFWVCAVAGLAALGVFLRSISLLPLAFLMLAALPQIFEMRYRVEKLRGQVRTDVALAALTSEELDALYGAATKLGQHHRNKPALRSRTMLSLYDALRRRSPAWRTSLALFGLWLLGVALVPLALFSVALTRRLVL